MAEYPHWNDVGSDDSWDNLLLGGEFMPGVATVEVEVSRKLDIKKPKGKDGFQMTDEGLEPASIDITLVIDHRDQLKQLATIMPKLRPPKKGGAHDPLEIQHPSALVAGVTAIVIEKIKIEQPSAKDAWRIRITAKEWVSGPKTNKGLGSAKGGGAQSCACYASQLQQAHHDLSAIAAKIQFIQGGGGTTAGANQAEADYNKKAAQINALESKLNTCAAGGAVPPPSQDAQENAVDNLSDAEKIKNILNAQAA